MAIPKINSNPEYDVVVPSTGERITYRPYLVKEEKILMLAFESGEGKQATRAIGNTLNACVQTEGFDAFKLTTYDVEFLFTTIRSRSVGETTQIIMPCKECKTKNNVVVDLSELTMDDAEVKTEVVELTDDISVELTYPTYGQVLQTELGESGIENSLAVISNSILSINTEEERYGRDDFTQNEVVEFVESLTTEQFRKLGTFLNGIPKLTKEVEFKCVECGTQNSSTLAGMQDFLS